MRVHILDDHPMMISGLELILRSAYSEINIITESDLSIAIDHLPFAKYDLSIIDINISGKRSFDYIKKAIDQHPKSKHLIFTSSIRQDYYEKIMKLNVDGYLVKECMPEDLIYAIKTVMKGRRFVDPIFYDCQDKKCEKNIDDLTSREREVLKLIGQGLTNQNIAQALFISVSTVKKHASSAMSKMEFDNRTEAALYCQSHYV